MVFWDALYFHSCAKRGVFRPHKPWKMAFQSSQTGFWSSKLVSRCVFKWYNHLKRRKNSSIFSRFSGRILIFQIVPSEGVFLPTILVVYAFRTHAMHHILCSVNRHIHHTTTVKFSALKKISWISHAIFRYFWRYYVKTGSKMSDNVA